MWRVVRKIEPLLIAGLLAGTGCAASRFDGNVYRDGDIAFRLGERPSGWRQIDIQDSAVAFRDDANAATIAVNARCGKDAEDVPLESLTHHLFLQFTEREQVHQTRVPLDGREALITEMTAKLDGVQKHFLVVVLKKDGCVYDLLRIADNSDAGAEEFERYYQTFETLPVDD